MRATYFILSLLLIFSWQLVARNKIVSGKSLIQKTKGLFLLFFFILILVQANALEHNAEPKFVEYTGRYIFPEGTMVDDAVITLSNDTLSATVALGSVVLVPAEQDSFVIPQYGGTVTFVRNGQNRITSLKVSIPMGGIEELEAKKELEVAEIKIERK